MKKTLVKRSTGKIVSGLVAVASNILNCNADMQEKQVFPTGNNPYGWNNLSSIVSNVTDNPLVQTGSYTNSLRIRCHFSNLPIENTNSYTMNIFNSDGQLYGSTKVPTNGRAQCDIFVSTPSISNPGVSLSTNGSLYLSANSTNGLVYALSFTGLTANAGQNITLTETNSSFLSSSIIGAIDSDGDNFRNDEEMFVGTNPYSSNDFLKIDSLIPNSPFLNIKWSGSSNTLIDIFESTNMAQTSQWNLVKHNVFNKSATLNWNGPQKFYKIKAIGKIQ
jgi:hypothetical protein